MRWTKTLVVFLAILVLVGSSRKVEERVAPGMSQNPSAAIISAADVQLFWKVYDLWLNRDRGAALSSNAKCHAVSTAGSACDRWWVP
jgi:hypothetical protein